MDQTTFDQLAMTPEQVGDAADYLLENIEVEILFFSEEQMWSKYAR